MSTLWSSRRLWRLMRSGIGGKRHCQGGQRIKCYSLENLPKKMINLTLMDVYILIRQAPVSIPTHPMYLEPFLAPEEREFEG